MSATLEEIARKLKLHKGSVSRILNGKGSHFSDQTRQRVLEAAAEMNYRPNHAARTLARGYSKTVVLWTVYLRSAYTAQVVYRTHQEITRHDYDLLILDAAIKGDGKVDTEKVLSLPSDGIILSNVPHAAIPGLEAGLLSGKPIVNMGAFVLQNADFVHLDLSLSAMEAVRHLHSIGCRRIAYLVPDLFDWFQRTDDARLRAYNTVISQLGRQPEFIVAPFPERQSVGPVLKAYVERMGAPDGLFCFNDEMAIGAFRALRDLGLRVPEDVALAGCDGIDETAYLDPSLTTIVSPMEQMCAQAWTFLERRMQDPSLPLQQITLQPHLEIRGSTRRV